MSLFLASISTQLASFTENQGESPALQGGEDVKTNREGTGFGLSIVSDIVAAHGWTISVTESESGGARFEIAGVGSEE